MLTSPDPGNAKDIKAGAIHRVWWIDDVPAGPLVISANTPEPDAAWLEDSVGPLIDSLAFG